ncbi:MAG: FIG004453: protein YceG like [uncultured Thiotrichaceae bacterium]|uniref:Endolytic murein transglycosylase n=1 Tax=uncultured Thiotrichaceae bacterium TaxID=298394 RepID=A0A6S6TLL0_9GAMM|nr:MAG: FIG004453: protein YceG like [uncultured Thiotrichaceae bacterium]
MKFLKWLFILILLAGSAAAFLAYKEYQSFLDTAVEVGADNSIFTVKKGSSFSKVATQLESQKLVKSAVLFKVLAKIRKQESKLKTGEYELPETVKPIELLDILTSGRSLQYKQVIIEGKSYKQLVESIKNNPNLKQTLSDEDYASIMEKLGSEFSKPEGMFFPDTYNFPRNTTDMQFLQRSYDDMQSFIQKAWENRVPHPKIKTPYEALILASIVEKETGHEAERPMIARVFLNRLERGMMLQTDPTVIYGMGDKYKGNIRKKDLKSDNPYNTYTRYGLPPTPIATPGREAINAVMHPPEGDALYFVAKGDGTSYFSKTYAEHRKAVIKYLLNGNSSRYQGGK